jgi:hypothetical protein
MQFRLRSLLRLTLPFLFTSSTFAQSSTQDESEPLRIQHRVVHPDLPITPWSELGTVALPPSGLHLISPVGTPAMLIPSDSLLDDLVEFAEKIDPTMEGAMYQVALERPGAPDGVWPVSVVKAVCSPSIQCLLGYRTQLGIQPVSCTRIDIIESQHPFLRLWPSIRSRLLRFASTS